ncbi:MAG TPA: response regulator [Aggregatilineales bacterium]|nr:response regulator [Anaerolineales bacterium]HRE49120.1 response regulator [Aggregatilineales bacterium]
MAISKTVLMGWKVVVIDDEPDSLEVATRILRYYGSAVTTAQNGMEGIERIREVRPRFVICDLSMPELDGWGVITILKMDDTLRDIPVIALTAHALLEDRTRAIAAGFHNYLTKPLTAATFMGELLNLLIDIPGFDMLRTESGTP